MQGEENTFRLSGPATALAIATAEKEIGETLPEDYRSFLLLHNGGSGYVNGSYTLLYKIDLVAKINGPQSVLADGFLMIGSIDTGMTIGWDRRDPAWPFVGNNAMGLTWDLRAYLRPSFADFLANPPTVAEYEWVGDDRL